MFILKNKKKKNLNEFFLEKKTTLYTKIDTPQKNGEGRKNFVRGQIELNRKNN
jgi:hypothetical protein